MISFTIPRITADRLTRLPLACADETGPLGQISVRCTASAVRFAATNGRILASLLVPIDHLEGDPADVLLDANQFATALKSAAKANGGRITVEIGQKEARITNGMASAIVRRVDGTFPQIDHVWTRPAGRRWIPTLSSLDHGLVAIAQKISGNRQPLLFASPVEPGASIERLWAVPGAQPDEVLPLGLLRSAISAPAYWADHELAFLVMPITRGDSERQLDLGAHALSLSASASAVAA
jgi:hypothetical protein